MVLVAEGHNRLNRLHQRAHRPFVERAMQLWQQRFQKTKELLAVLIGLFLCPTFVFRGEQLFLWQVRNYGILV